MHISTLEYAMNKKETFFLKNMFSQSCIKLIELSFNAQENISIKTIALGEVQLEYNPEIISHNSIQEQFLKLGFATINDPDVEIVEKTKVAAIELIHESLNNNSLVRNSEYISDKVQLPYDRISRVFSKVTGTQLEKVIILLKIEKAKELLIGNEYNVSEIAYMMDYSSVQYFSNQFKKTVGVTISEFKEAPQKYRKTLEEII